MSSSPKEKPPTSKAVDQKAAPSMAKPRGEGSAAKPSDGNVSNQISPKKEATPPSKVETAGGQREKPSAEFALSETHGVLPEVTESELASAERLLLPEGNMPLQGSSTQDGTGEEEVDNLQTVLYYERPLKYVQLPSAQLSDASEVSSPVNQEKTEKSEKSDGTSSPISEWKQDGLGEWKGQTKSEVLHDEHKKVRSDTPSVNVPESVGVERPSDSHVSFPPEEVEMQKLPHGTDDYDILLSMDQKDRVTTSQEHGTRVGVARTGSVVRHVEQDIGVVRRSHLLPHTAEIATKPPSTATMEDVTPPPSPPGGARRRRKNLVQRAFMPIASIEVIQPTSTSFDSKATKKLSLSTAVIKAMQLSQERHVRRLTNASKKSDATATQRRSSAVERTKPAMAFGKADQIGQPAPIERRTASHGRPSGIEPTKGKPVQRSVAGLQSPQTAQGKIPMTAAQVEQKKLSAGTATSTSKIPSLSSDTIQHEQIPVASESKPISPVSGAFQQKRIPASSTTSKPMSPVSGTVQRMQAPVASSTTTDPSSLQSGIQRMRAPPMEEVIQPESTYADWTTTKKLGLSTALAKDMPLAYEHNIHRVITSSQELDAAAGQRELSVQQADLAMAFGTMDKIGRPSTVEQRSASQDKHQEAGGTTGLFMVSSPKSVDFTATINVSGHGEIFHRGFTVAATSLMTVESPGEPPEISHNVNVNVDAEESLDAEQLSSSFSKGDATRIKEKVGDYDGLSLPKGEAIDQSDRPISNAGQSRIDQSPTQVRRGRTSQSIRTNLGSDQSATPISLGSTSLDQTSADLFGGHRGAADQFEDLRIRTRSRGRRLSPPRERWSTRISNGSDQLRIDQSPGLESAPPVSTIKGTRRVRSAGSDRHGRRSPLLGNSGTLLSPWRTTFRGPDVTDFICQMMKPSPASPIDEISGSPGAADKVYVGSQRRSGQ